MTIILSSKHNSHRFPPESVLGLPCLLICYVSFIFTIDPHHLSPFVSKAIRFISIVNLTILHPHELAIYASTRLYTLDNILYSYLSILVWTDQAYPAHIRKYGASYPSKARPYNFYILHECCVSYLLP